MTAHELRPPGSGRGINLLPVLRLPACGDLWNPTRAARAAESQMARALAVAQTSGTMAIGAAVFAAEPAQFDPAKQRSAIRAAALANRPAAAGMEPNGKGGFERLRPSPLRTAGPAGRSRFPLHSLLPAGENAVGGAGGGGRCRAERAAPAAVPPRRGACLPGKAARAAGACPHGYSAGRGRPRPAAQPVPPPPGRIVPSFPALRPHAEAGGRAA